MKLRVVEGFVSAGGHVVQPMLREDDHVHRDLREEPLRVSTATIHSRPCQVGQVLVDVTSSSYESLGSLRSNCRSGRPSRSEVPRGQVVTPGICAIQQELHHGPSVKERDLKAGVREDLIRRSVPHHKPPRGGHGAHLHFIRHCLERLVFSRRALAEVKSAIPQAVSYVHNETVVTNSDLITYDGTGIDAESTRGHSAWLGGRRRETSLRECPVAAHCAPRHPTCSGAAC